jgi:hypothetical protein
LMIEVVPEEGDDGGEKGDSEGRWQDNIVSKKCCSRSSFY